VVKAFNTTGAENLADSAYPDGRPFMPVCGDDVEARVWVIELADRLGFDAVDCGELSAARYLEPFAMTWIHLAIRLGLTVASSPSTACGAERRRPLPLEGNARGKRCVVVFPGRA
jgi:predicted dinucleotide-binding enzyme